MSYAAFQQTNSSISDSDDRYYLRTLDFPLCVKEALIAIVNLSRITNSTTVQQQIQLQTDLMTEFIFGEIEKLKLQNKPRALLEFQLVEILSDFFRSSEISPAVRNGIFLLLFPGECPRYEILGLLVSMAICTQNREVLDSTGMWIQQLGSTSTQSVGLATHILDDFFVYSPKSIDRLKKLPVLVPYFTANLLTAIGEVYKFDDPPNELLELIGNWINDNPGLLTTSLIDNPALPSGGIPMTPVTPIAGLFRWCILSPARKESATVHNDKKKVEDRNKLYSKIQHLLLDAMRRLQNCRGNKNAISAQHLAQTTRFLSSLLESIDTNISSVDSDLALARLAQAVSTALSVNCMYGNKQELLVLLQPLTNKHFLVELTLCTHGTKPPIV